MSTQNSEHEKTLLGTLLNCFVVTSGLFLCLYLWNTWFASKVVPAVAPTQNVSVSTQQTPPKYKHTRIADIKVGERVVTSNVELPSHRNITKTFVDLHNHIDDSENQLVLRYPPDDVIKDSLELIVSRGIIINASSKSGINVNSIIGTSYIPGDIDGTDITPLLWRHIDLVMYKPDGDIAEINILRPLWWVQNTHTLVGSDIDIGFEEIGISGFAKVIAIKPCTSSSLDNLPGLQIVTGKIQHRHAETWNLYFGNDNKVAQIGVTQHHPLFSVDRNIWIPAGDIAINERVATIDGIVVLSKKEKRSDDETVINIEVHRSHVYHVSQINILAHNTIFLDCSKTAVFRGGSKMIPRNRDIPVTDNGMVLPETGGLSVNTVPEKINVSFGRPRQIISIPDDLVIRNVPEGSTHYQIEPRIEMTFEKYKELLSQVQLGQ
jgi:hypothetical protein